MRTTGTCTTSMDFANVAQPTGSRRVPGIPALYEADVTARGLQGDGQDFSGVPLPMAERFAHFGPAAQAEDCQGDARLLPYVGGPLRDAKAPEGVKVVSGPALQVASPRGSPRGLRPGEPDSEPPPPEGPPRCVEQREEINAFAPGGEAPRDLPGEDPPRALAYEGVRTVRLRFLDHLEGRLHDVPDRRGILAGVKTEEEAVGLHAASEPRVGH